MIRFLRRLLKRRHSRLYRTYMRSAAWRAKKAEAYQFYGRECAVCASQNRLEVHHKHYRTLGHERMQDVQILCKDHHRQADKARRQKARWI